MATTLIRVAALLFLGLGVLKISALVVVLSAGTGAEEPNFVARQSIYAIACLGAALALWKHTIRGSQSTEDPN